MLILFLVLSIFLLVTANVPACPPGGIHFNPPRNLSVGTIFPPQMNGSQPQLPANYLCTYKINVPVGLFADVAVTFLPTNQTDQNTMVVVTDQSNFSETLTRTSTSGLGETFFFVSNGGNIFLSTGNSEVYFKLWIYWSKLPTVFEPIRIQLNVSNTQPDTILIQNATDAYIVTAETRVSILALPSIYDFHKFILRGIYVFDGPSWNSTLIGSAMQLWTSNKQWVSTGNQLTVQFLYYNSNDERSRIVLQDYENTKHIVNYQCGYCPNYQKYPVGVDCQGILDNSLGTSAFMTYLDARYSSTETLTHLDGNGTLDVYIGGITQSKSNLVVSYSVQNPGLTLPQTFAGTIRTYVLEGVHSRAVMNLTTVSPQTLDLVGTKKLVMSSFYPQLHSGQHASVLVAPPNHTVVTFSFRFLTADFGKNTTMSMLIRSSYESKKFSYDKKFTSANPPPVNQTIQIVGDVMQLYMESYEGEGKGLLMEYEILKTGSSNFYLLTFVSVLVLGLL